MGVLLHNYLLARHLPAISHFHSLLSRGLWTWSPWVICSPAFNHKIGNAAHSGVSEVLFFTKSYKWNKRRWEKWTTGRLLLEIMCFWRPPTVRQFQDGWPRMRAQQKCKLLNVAWQCPDYSLSFPCSISFAESFVACLRNKAYIYLKNLLTYFNFSLTALPHPPSIAESLVLTIRQSFVELTVFAYIPIWVYSSFYVWYAGQPTKPYYARQSPEASVPAITLKMKVCDRSARTAKTIVRFADNAKLCANLLDVGREVLKQASNLSGYSSLRKLIQTPS